MLQHSLQLHQFENKIKKDEHQNGWFYYMSLQFEGNAHMIPPYSTKLTVIFRRSGSFFCLVGAFKDTCNPNARKTWKGQAAFHEGLL